MQNLNLLRIRLVFVFVASIVASSCTSVPKTTENPCLQRRGAIDIGSGSTKAFAAVVDICATPKKIVEKLFDSKVKISFGEAVEQSPDGKIPAEMITDASVKIAGLAEGMNAQGLDNLEAVATAAIRKSKNRDEVISAIAKSISDRLATKTKIKPEALTVRVLSQIEEAQVGANSALANLPADSESQRPSVVWDIGGGSMQITDVETNEVFTGQLASVTFKNQVISDIQKKDLATAKSPNPLDTKKKQSSKKAVALAKKYADGNLGSFLEAHKRNPRWIGIGGVLALSVQKQVEREEQSPRLNPGHPASFTQTALTKTLEKRALRTDDEIDSEYRETEITNLALVLGFMQALKADKVETVEASLVQGLVLR